MPHPKQGYALKDGTKVPGTTTIIGRFKESGALIAWAYKRGKDGLELYDSRDKAAEIGTVVHDMVERFIALEDPMKAMEALKTESDCKAARSAFNAFDEWFEANKIKVVAQEMQLVSETYRFGGTPDAVAEDSKGRLVLLDWKTSDGVYMDYLCQLGAYRILWNENNPGNPLTGGSHLCRFSKAHGDFTHHFFPNLDDAEQAFILMRSLYDLDKSLKKRV
jgi:hypothetical protein